MTTRTPYRRADAPVALKWLAQAEQIKLLSLLLEARPELRAEAGALALKIITTVNPGTVAEEVLWAFQGFDQDEVLRMSDHYSIGRTTGLAEVARHICEERFDPLMERLERLISIGQMEAALAHVKGLLIGLYRLEAKVPPEAEDFPLNIGATQVLKLWAKKAPGDIATAMAEWLHYEAPVNWASHLETLWRALRVRSRKPI